MLTALKIFLPTQNIEGTHLVLQVLISSFLLAGRILCSANHLILCVKTDEFGIVIDLDAFPH